MSDIKNAENYSTSASSWKFLADVRSLGNYYPYGSAIGAGSWSGSSYNFGYNGMLKEGIGDDIYHTHYRNLSDGRWWSPDPLEYQFPSFSPYVSMGANPISFVDLLGLKPENPPKNADKGGMVVSDDDGTWNWNAHSQEWIEEKAVSDEAIVYGKREPTTATNPSTDNKIQDELKVNHGNYSEWYTAYGHQFDNRVDAYSYWRDYPLKHEGEGSFDFWMRQSSSATWAAKFDFGHGLMFGGGSRSVALSRGSSSAIKGLKRIGGLSIRKDIVLSGGRGGKNVKNLIGPPNSVVKGSPGRIFITNEKGQVIWDVNKLRAKPVVPGSGYRQTQNKPKPTDAQLKLIKEIWGE